MLRLYTCLFFIALLAPGCDNNEDPKDTPIKDMPADVSVADMTDMAPDQSTTGTALRFDPTGTFFDTPFPSDVKLTVEGKIDLTSWKSAYGSRILPLWFDAIKELNTGWSPISGVFHYFDGPLDPTSLPQTLDESVSKDGSFPSVFLMNVDPNSSERGKMYPIRCRFQAEAGVLFDQNQLACMSPFGVVRQFNTQYAFVMTDKLKDAKGQSLQTPKAMASLMAGTSITGADRMIDGQPYKDAVAFLGQSGLDANKIVALNLFTTGDPTARLRRINTFYEALPEPTLDRTKKIKIIETYDDYVVLEAYYNVPIVQEGEFPYSKTPAGKITFDAAGKVSQVGEQSIRVFITIPKIQMPDGGYPVLMYMHGSGGVARELIDRGAKPDVNTPAPAGSGPGGVVAKFGVAGFAADFQFHGMRYTPSDNTGLLLYNLFGNPRATVDNFIVAANEVTLHARLMKSLVLDPNEIEQLDGTPITFDVGAAPDGMIRFNSDRFAAMGQSMGSTIGLPAMTIDRVTDAGIFSGSGGILIEIAVTSMKPVDVGQALRVFLRYKDAPLDQWDPALHAVQHLWDFVDPVVHAKHVFLQPQNNVPPKHVIQHSGIADGYFTADSRAAFSLAIGADLVTPVYEPSALEIMALGGHGTALEPPVQNNINQVTGVVLQYEPEVLDGHNVAYQLESAQYQYGCFIKSLGKDSSPIVRAVAQSSPENCP